MLDGNNGQESKPDMQESYASAVSAGNTRVQPHKFSHADLIAAAGMSDLHMGKALMRLASEWQSGATPRQAETPGTKDLAKRAVIARVDAGIQASEEEYGGMAVSAKRERRAAGPLTRHEVELAEAQARQLAAQSTDWNLHEQKLRFQRLKSLPTVRAGLLHWVRERGWEDGEYMVAKVLERFLSPFCAACGGSGVREFAGNNRRGAGKPCPKCKARKEEGVISVMGEMPIPCHGQGRKLLSHIRSCIARAAGDMQEGAHKERRSAASTQAREERKKHAKVAQLQRADAEAKADEAQDNAEVAEGFRRSLGQRRKT